MSLLGGIAYSTYQARRAEARFQQVRKLANTFVFDVHDAIQPLAGSTKARQLLVSTGLEYLDSLAAEARGDPELQWELAQAYIKLGNVQGSPRAGPHLGDTAGALASHRKAINLLDQLALSAPSDLKVLSALVTSSQAAGDLELYAGNRPQALNAYARTIETARKIVENPQHEPKDLRSRAIAQVRIGNQQLAQGEGAAAVASLEGAVEDLRNFAKGMPVAQGQPAVAYGLQYLGQAYGGRGEMNVLFIPIAKLCAFERDSLIAIRMTRHCAESCLSLTHCLQTSSSLPSSSPQANGARPCLFTARHSRSAKKWLPPTTATPGPSAI